MAEGSSRKITSIQNDIEGYGNEARDDRDRLSLLEPKHYPHIVSAHTEIFTELAGWKAHVVANTGGNPKTLMREVADWRNVSAHPPARLESTAVDRAIEAMSCLVRLFDVNARVDLQQLSDEARNQVEPEHSPAATVKAETEARSIVQQAQAQALKIRSEAQREASATRKQAQAFLAEARDKDRASRSSRSRNLVKREDRHKLDRIQNRVRDLQEQESNALARLKTVRRNIQVLERRARTLKERADKARLEEGLTNRERTRQREESERAAKMRAQEEADAILRAAHEEANAIRLQPQRSETFKSLVREAIANARGTSPSSNLSNLDPGRGATENSRRRRANGIVRHAEEEAIRIKREAYDTRNRIIDEGERTASGIVKQARQNAETVKAKAREAAETVKATAARQAPKSSATFRELFKPARSGNGSLLSLTIDGWRLNCWVGRTNGLPLACVFAPTRTLNGKRTEARDTPLMESVCASEEAAFEWLREREEGGHIRREARRAIRLFEGAEADDEPTLESDALDNDIPF